MGVAAQAQICLRTVNVSNTVTLNAALAAALPGDCIVLADGNYSGFTMNVSGTAANPITIHATNVGGAVINSGFVKLNNVDYVTVRGLRFTSSGGSTTVGDRTWTVGVALADCNFCRVTRCTFKFSGMSSSGKWCIIGGDSKSNRVDHCEFGPLSASVNNVWVYPTGNATIAGVTPNPVVDRGPWAQGNGPYNPNMARYTQIDHNYFHDKTNNTAEVMVLGGSPGGMIGDYQDAFNLVEYNLISNCDGDAEIIATKSSSATIRFNTVRTSNGLLSLRAGNRSSVYGNFMFQGAKAGAGGIKFYEKDHRIFNNYIQDGTEYPILIGGGDPYTTNTFDHAQVFRARVVHNTIVNPARPFRIGHGSPLAPADSLVANNIITGTGDLFCECLTPINMSYSKNIIFGENPGKPAAQFLVTNPSLTPVGEVSKLSAGSPAINYADTNYFPYVTDDADGQGRGAAKDTGADEFAATDVIRRPLTTNEVGPWVVDFDVTAAPSSQSVTPGNVITYAVNVTGFAGFTNGVALFISGLPAGTSANFDPAVVTNGSGASVLTLTASNGAPSGVYQLTISGNSSNLTSSASVGLIVNRAPANLKWASSDNGYWDVLTTANWTNLGNNQPDWFFPGDNVLFDDTANMLTNISIVFGAAVAPNVLSNNSSTRHFTIGNAGKITGGAGIVKSGSSTLTLNTTNDFTGAVRLFGGVIKLGNSSALGATNGGLFITNAATLDLTANNINLGLKPITVSGAGVGGNGAIINSSGSAAFVGPNFANVTLAGDTTIGGAGRIDFRSNPVTGTNAALSTGGNGFKLTKVGANQLQLAGVIMDPALGDIEVQAGIFGLQANTSLGNPAGSLTVFSNATLQLFQTSNTLAKALVLRDGAIVNNNNGPNIWGGPVTLQGSNIFNVSGSWLLLTNTLNGTGTLAKVTGSSPLFLAASNTFRGRTLVGVGILALTNQGSLSACSNILVNAGATLSATGRPDGTLALVSGQTLQGDGAIHGSVQVGAGATLSPGTSIGALTITNVVTLEGTAFMELNAQTGTNDVIRGAQAIHFGGTLSLTNLAGALTTNSAFKLFHATNYTGAFAVIEPPTPGASLAWDTGSLGVNGTLKITTPPLPSPRITSFVVSGTDLIFAGTNGAMNGSFYLRATTNLVLPLTNWSIVGTGQFDAGGNFILTNFADPGSPHRFFRLQSQ